MLDKDQGFGIVSRWNEFAKDEVTVHVTDASAFTMYHLLSLLPESRVKGEK